MSHKEHPLSQAAEQIENFETQGILLSHIVGHVRFIPIVGAVLTGCSLISQMLGWDLTLKNFYCRKPH